MAYTKTNWLETSMSTAQKLTALDNLEGMYGQITTYIDAITHSGDYYTDAEAEAKFFSNSTDGTGSGLVCATLDGQTADEIIAAGSPQGVIAWWSGSEEIIPAGWALCDGNNSTPDLRAKFVVGAGGNYAKGASGGSNLVTPAGAVTIAGHSLTAAEIAKHTHGTIKDSYIGSGGAYFESGGYVGGGSNFIASGDYDHTEATGSQGSGSSHTHSATFTGDQQSKLPSYYAMCYIMRV